MFFLHLPFSCEIICHLSRFCFRWYFCDMSLIHPKFLLVVQIPPPLWYRLVYYVTWLNLLSVVTRPLHSIKKEQIGHTSSVLESPSLWWCHRCRCAGVFTVVAMALLPSSRWCHCHCRSAGVLPLSTMMATAQRATASTTIVTVWRTSTRTTASATNINTDNGFDDNGGDDATGNEDVVDGNGAIKYDDCDGMMDGACDDNNNDGVMDNYDGGNDDDVDGDGVMDENDDNNNDDCDGQQRWWQRQRQRRGLQRTRTLTTPDETTMTMTMTTRATTPALLQTTRATIASSLTAGGRIIK